MVTRSQHRRNTLLDLSTAACDLFEEKGTAATLQEIAQRAGVARRTLFRYVDHKEDLAFLHPRIWLDVLTEAQAELTDGSVRDRLVHGARRISEHIDRDPEPVRRAMRVAQSIPALAKGNAVVQQLWIQRLTAEVRHGQTDADEFRAHILAAAVMGVINAAIIEWYRGPDDLRLVDLVERGLDFIAPILEP
ncbi:MAG: TetR family transcriptional regulator [Acidimicrobiia bacterium]|nr:TetR family transcriptional regulator [Acidimicrobiia bacterium]